MLTCRDANAGLSLLISRRQVIDMTSGPRVQPPWADELLTEAARVRQTRIRAEYHIQIKAEVARAVGGIKGSLKGFLFGSSRSKSQPATADGGGGGGGAAKSSADDK
jgi:hypothetical protein